jgi:hypothetical protein
MPPPIEAYRQGYEKGRSDSAGGRLAEMTMGMLRDDPGGDFQKGYSDGAAGKPFNPPSIPTPSRLRTNGLMPKFSENPFGWFLGVLIVIELWTLWQLIKAPFQLVGSLMRSEKPSPWVIVKNVIVVGLVIALVWWVPHTSAPNQQAAIGIPIGTAPGTRAVEPVQAPPSGIVTAPAAKTVACEADVELQQTFEVDLDRCQQTTAPLDPGADIWFEAESAERKFITPRNGALLYTLGKGRHRMPSVDELRQIPFDAQRIPFEDLAELHIVYVRTTEGHISLVRFARLPAVSEVGTIGLHVLTWN